MPSRARAPSASTLSAVLVLAPATAHLENHLGPNGAGLEEIVVTAQRRADESLQRQVKTALDSDRYFDGDHVTVTVANGVATLHGLIFDEWDLRNAVRISKRIPGVKRVVNDLEIEQGGE